MRKRLIEYILAKKSSDYIKDRQLTLEQIINVILVGFAIIAALVYGINAILLFQQNALILATFYAINLIWIFVIAFIRRLPYTFRVVSMLIILFGLGLLSTIQMGNPLNSLIWFFALSVLASLFIGIRSSIIFVIINTLTFIILYSITLNGGMISFFTGSLSYSENPYEWFFLVISYPVLSLMTIISIGFLTDRFESKIQKSTDLVKELLHDRKELKHRAETLERRELQVRIAAEISRSVIAELDPDTIFQRVVDLLQNQFDLYFVGVFTLDKSGHFAVLQAGTGEPGTNLLARRHQFAIDNTSMIGSAIRDKEPQIATNLDMENYQDNYPDLPLTYSELALPMIAAEQILGAITIQSTEVNAFDEEDIIVYQSITDSLAIATINAIQFQQVQTSLEDIQNLHNQYLSDSWEKATSREGSFEYTYEREDDYAPNVLDTPLPPLSMNLPLLLRDQPIGNLSIEADRSALSPQEHAFIDSVLQQTALALENLRLNEETQFAAQQDQVVNRISEELTHAMDVESVIKTAVRELGRLPNIAEVSVHIEPIEDDH